MKTCAHPHCDVEIADYQLACRPHWYELPTPLRNRIWKYYANDNHVAHSKAITDALTTWAGPPPPGRGVRCAHCRQPTDLRAPTTGAGCCITCAKSRLTPTGHKTPACHSCGRTVDITVTINDQPTLCLDCQHLELLNLESAST